MLCGTMVWPFTRRSEKQEIGALATIDEAISFVAQRWLVFSSSVARKPDSDLRDRVALFARSVNESLHRRFPALVAASDEVLLLIVAKGIEQSGAVPRSDIERSLGIVLPP